MLRIRADVGNHLSKYSRVNSLASRRRAKKFYLFLATPCPGGIAIPKARPTGENSAREASARAKAYPCGRATQSLHSEPGKALLNG